MSAQKRVVISEIITIKPKFKQTFMIALMYVHAVVLYVYDVHNHSHQSLVTAFHGCI